MTGGRGVGEEGARRTSRLKTMEMMKTKWSRSKQHEDTPAEETGDTASGQLPW